tara:strand:- start:139 stop:972 length:834 start_codon:yes stop_codon:yes gene_type:complete
MFLDSAIVYGHGTDNAWDEAVYLVTSLSGYPDSEQSIALEVSQEIERKIIDYAERRIEERIPLAYLLGFCRYAGHRFSIKEGVVIPRSPIGLLVSEGHLKSWVGKGVRRILDLCTGSGCLGILAAHEYPEAEVVLVDKEPLAIDLAKANVQEHDLQSRVSVVKMDVTSETLGDLGEFDLILCNPPYVDEIDMRSLPEEFSKEPTVGLDGGVDGMDVVTHVIRHAKKHLTETGYLICEVGGSAAAFNRIFSERAPLALEPALAGEGLFLLESKSLKAI